MTIYSSFMSQVTTRHWLHLLLNARRCQSTSSAANVEACTEPLPFEKYNLYLELWLRTTTHTGVLKYKAPSGEGDANCG